jgi:hypothetical protein
MKFLFTNRIVKDQRPYNFAVAIMPKYIKAEDTMPNITDEKLSNI